MKRVIQILIIIFMIIGIIIIATKGFNVGLKYSENTVVTVNIGKDFNAEDVKEISKEVFETKNVIVEKVELYKDTAQITVKSATTEQIENLNTKINEKYGIENESSSITMLQNANTKLSNLVKPYLIPITISTGIIVVYLLFRFRNIGLWKLIYNEIIYIIAPQALLFSCYAITRLPINRFTQIISISIYVLSVIAIFISLMKKKETIENDKKVEKNNI